MYELQTQSAVQHTSPGCAHSLYTRHAKYHNSLDSTPRCNNCYFVFPVQLRGCLTRLDILLLYIIFSCVQLWNCRNIRLLDTYTDVIQPKSFSNTVSVRALRIAIHLIRITYKDPSTNNRDLSPHKLKKLSY